MGYSSKHQGVLSIKGQEQLRWRRGLATISMHSFNIQLFLLHPFVSVANHYQITYKASELKQC